MSEEKTPQKELVPLWVALAGLLVAFICGAIILANTVGSLYRLVFPLDADVPLPSNAVELEHNPDSRLSDEEWLYGSTQSGCDIAAFYLEQGATCRISPLACDVPDGVAEMTDPALPDMPVEAVPISVCEFTHQETLSSYSWQVIISSGYADYDTKFRVYLYTER